MAMKVRAGYLGKSGAPQRYVSLHAAGVPPEQSSLWDAELDDMGHARWAEQPFSRDTGSKRKCASEAPAFTLRLAPPRSACYPSRPLHTSGRR